VGHTAGYHHGVAPQGALPIHAGDQHSGELEMQIGQMLKSANRRIEGGSVASHCWRMLA